MNRRRRLSSTTFNHITMTTEKQNANAPTPQRPGEPHLLDAPLIEIDLAHFARRLKTEPPWKTGDRNAVTLCKTQGLRVVMMALHEGSVLAEHATAGILSLQVLEGKIRFADQGKTYDLAQGQMLCLHKGIRHGLTAVTESVVLLTLAWLPEG